MNNSGKLAILIVTNSNFLNDTFKKFLNNRVIDVYCCNGGLQCIKHAVEKSPTMIFIDVNLDGFSSVDTLKVLHALKVITRIPTVLMLSYSQNTVLSGMIDLGISTLLYKPFNRNEVLNVVNNLLGEEIRKKTEALPVMEAVIVNAELNKTSTASKFEQMNKIKTLKTFLNNIPGIKKEIITNISLKNIDGYVKLIKDIKPYGNNIGYPRLTLICDFLEKRLSNSFSINDWDEIDKYSHEVISLFDLIAHDNKISTF